MSHILFEQIALQDTCLMESVVASSAVRILKNLYDCEILSEEMLFKWHGNIPDGVDQFQEREELRKKVSYSKILQFIM